jgi:hypothetical protein
MDAGKLPNGIIDLADGFSFEWSLDFRYQNVKSDNGKHATVMYLGEDVTEFEIIKVYTRIAEFLRRFADSDDNSLENRERLVVFYSDSAGHPMYYINPELTRFDSPRNISGFDIRRPQ